ncbi:MAG: hypothetical protein IPM46_04980 [Flavobacteriales bacterium]|nr:hypothetical protein [Flavobacteriales bacterium]
MTLQLSRIDTPIATVQRIAEDMTEVRLKPGCTLTVPGIAGILAARQEVAVGVPQRVLFVFPEEEVDFDMSMITKDHYATVPAGEFTRAVAWAMGNPHNERFCQLYFAYFPSPMPSAIFLTEEEARTWLDGQ